MEWLSEGTGSGAATLALIAAREACRAGGVLAVLDAERSFYPPAAADLAGKPATKIRFLDYDWSLNDVK